jgi:hypothetical protein
MASMSGDVKYWLTLVGVVALAVSLAAVVSHQLREPVQPDPQEIRARVDRIKIGMTYAEAKAIIGNCKKITTWKDGSRGDLDTANWPAPSEDTWYYIMLDDEHIVVGKQIKTAPHPRVAPR